jgi:hypothetical protein
MKLRGLVPNYHIHVSVSNLYTPTIGPPILLQKIRGQIVGIYKSLTDTVKRPKFDILFGENIFFLQNLFR